MTAQLKQKVTPQEYLELEKNALDKNEYYNGEIFAMVGARLNHNRINRNIASLLWNQLSSGSCEVFQSDQRVKIEAIEKYTYPDIVVACEGMLILEDELDSLTNPIVIIEILSDSTEAYDRGLKFEHYRLLPSLEVYILAAQDRCLIEQYVRNRDDETWILSIHTDIKKIIQIPPIQCELEVSKIYHRVEFKSETVN